MSITIRFIALFLIVQYLEPGVNAQSMICVGPVGHGNVRVSVTAPSAVRVHPDPLDQDCNASCAKNSKSAIIFPKALK